MVRTRRGCLARRLRTGIGCRHIVLLCALDFRDDECASFSNLQTLNYSTQEGGVFIQFVWPMGLLSLGAIFLGGVKIRMFQMHSPQK